MLLYFCLLFASSLCICIELNLIPLVGVEAKYSKLPHQHYLFESTNSGRKSALHLTKGVPVGLDLLNISEETSLAEEVKFKAPISKSAVTSLASCRGGFTSTEQVQNALPLPVIKLLLQLSLTTLNVVSWYLPLRYPVLTENASILGLANCFTGGLFLMLGFGHLIPEAAHIFTKMSSSSSILPSGNWIGESALKKTAGYTISGFLLMLFIDKIFFDTHGNEGEEKNTQLTGNNVKLSALPVNSAVVLCAAMSIHSFFEAAAIGVALDFTSALLIAAGIGLHQPAESIALLVAFLKQSKPSNKGDISYMSRETIIRYLCAFSCVGMIGVSTGILVQNIVGGSELEGAIIALTAGTFLFVSMTEIAGEEFSDLCSRERYQRFGAYIGGLLLMLLFSLYAD